MLNCTTNYRSHQASPGFSNMEVSVRTRLYHQYCGKVPVSPRQIQEKNDASSDISMCKQGNREKIWSFICPSRTAQVKKPHIQLNCPDGHNSHQIVQAPSNIPVMKQETVYRPCRTRHHFFIVPAKLVHQNTPFRFLYGRWKRDELCRAKPGAARSDSSMDDGNKRIWPRPWQRV